MDIQLTEMRKADIGRVITYFAELNKLIINRCMPYP